MLRFFILASLLSLPAFAADPIVVNSGERQTAVLELYTSEGCSSCPPADRWLSTLVGTAQPELDVLALAFHVDYWNYLGWKDRFSSADYTKRQRELGANNLTHVEILSGLSEGDRIHLVRPRGAKLPDQDERGEDSALPAGSAEESAQLDIGGVGPGAGTSGAGG